MDFSAEIEAPPGMEEEPVADDDVMEASDENAVENIESTADGTATEVDEQLTENGKADKTAAADDFLKDDDDSDEDDFVVTIGEIKPNASFQKGPAQVAGVTGLAGGRPELDGTPTHKGVLIYDVDLASMEEKPWRKPGADLTDYFNYGFNEDTWNQYCERQKKLRYEYGTSQEAINRALFNNISLPLGLGGQQLSNMNGGRQLVNILSSTEKPKINKVVIDLSKPPPDSQSVIRTIIGGNPADTSLNSSLISLGNHDTSVSSQLGGMGGGSSSNLVGLTSGGAPPTDFSVPPPSATPVSSSAASFGGPPPIASDFSKPPPSIPSSTPSSGTSLNTMPTATHGQINLTQPPPMNVGISAMKMSPRNANECPPGVDEPDIPGVSTPPPGLTSFPPMGNISAQPSQMGGFNPSIPPPGGRLPGMNVPPPSLFPQQQFLPNTGGAVCGSGVLYSSRPQPLFPGRGSAGFGSSMDGGGEIGGRRGGRDYRDRDRERDRDRDRDRERDRDRDRDYTGKDFSSGDSADESYRRKRRRRSRSVSVDRSSRRRKDDKERDRDRDRDRDAYTSTSASRRHESPHDNPSSSSRSTKRKSDREKDRTSENKRRSRRSPDAEHGGGSEQIEERSDRRRKKHDRSEKEKERDKEKT